MSKLFLENWISRYSFQNIDYIFKILNCYCPTKEIAISKNLINHFQLSLQQLEFSCLISSNAGPKKQPFHHMLLLPEAFSKLKVDAPQCNAFPECIKSKGPESIERNAGSFKGQKITCHQKILTISQETRIMTWLWRGTYSNHTIVQNLDSSSYDIMSEYALQRSILYMFFHIYTY